MSLYANGVYHRMSRHVHARASWHPLAAHGGMEGGWRGRGRVCEGGMGVRGSTWLGSAWHACTACSGMLQRAVRPRCAGPPIIKHRHGCQPAVHTWRQPPPWSATPAALLTSSSHTRITCAAPPHTCRAGLQGGPLAADDDGGGVWGVGGAGGAPAGGRGAAQRGG